jgi:hypothetical protein
MRKEIPRGTVQTLTQRASPSLKVKGGLVSLGIFLSWLGYLRYRSALLSILIEVMLVFYYIVYKSLSLLFTFLPDVIMHVSRFTTSSGQL